MIPRMPRVLGVDGCAAGWVGVVLDGRREPTALFGVTIGDVVGAAGPVEVVGIDMPIHPPESRARASVT